MDTKISKRFILFWLSQSISQLGSSMTGFALVIWSYKQTHSAMALSLLTFFYYLPYIVASIFSGAFVDIHNKKSIMLCADSIAAICSLGVITLLFLDNLQIWHIYIINTITGFVNAFQNPAATVAVGLLVSPKAYTRVSGLNSFSNSLVMAVTPMLAAFISSFWGLGGVLFIDLITFLLAFSILLFLIQILEHHLNEQKPKVQNRLGGCREGFVFLNEHKRLWYLIASMALLNFLSRLTYENILPAMILARSGGNNNVLGLVSGILGFGGIIGGLLVSVMKTSKSSTKMIYFSAGISFLFGDLPMGMGRNAFIWVLAALAASVPIPFIAAGQNILIYNAVPKEMQGRVFAARNAMQYFTIPIGILLGGVLAEYVFEPFMRGTFGAPLILRHLVGAGKGSGMAVMFLCTGILGFVFCVYFYTRQQRRSLETGN